MWKCPGASEPASGHGFARRYRLCGGLVVCAGLTALDAGNVLRQCAFGMKRAGKDFDIYVAQARRAVLAADLGTTTPAKVTPFVCGAQGLAGSTPLLENREYFWRTPAQFEKRSHFDAVMARAPAGLGTFAGSKGFVEHGVLFRNWDFGFRIYDAGDCRNWYFTRWQNCVRLRG